jgi:hypothetical protein
MFSILRGDFHENDSEGRDAFPGRPKCSEFCLGYSRDGFHWARPTHETFAGISEQRGDWNWGNIQSTGNSFVVVGDNLYFYVSGRRGAPEYSDQNTDLLNAAYADCSTGLAILRRDGFASLDSDLTSGKPGTLTTRKQQFSGVELFVNADVPAGELRVEVLDEGGRVIAPFSREKCVPIRSDKTLQAVSWKDADLSVLAGKQVWFRFHVTKGRLFSFWVSNDENGSSNGYVAGGGPVFSASRDEVGSASLSVNQPSLADAGTAQTVRDIDGNGVQPVLFDGSRSVDNDDQCRDFRWPINGQQLASGIKATIELPVGKHDDLSRRQGQRRCGRLR